MEKLTKAEWEAIEHPVSPQELEILRFLQKAYRQTDLVENALPTLYTFLKVDVSPTMDKNLYEFALTGKPPTGANKATAIRLEQSAKHMSKEIYETILLALVADFERGKDRLRDYYSLFVMQNLRVRLPNPLVKARVQTLLDTYSPNLVELVHRSAEIIERNPYAYKFQDLSLYPHQKQLFELAPGLVWLTAPTGTGKTLTPIALAEKYKVVFVCAARHVGIAFAKSCYAVGKKVAFGFGCTGVEDVRLHNSAAVEFERNKRTGAIFKVNHAIGDLVEVTVSDAHSLKHVLAWWRIQKDFDPTNMVLYWDEPTIGLDRADHPLHPVLREVWSENYIPYVVLSSATLPHPTDVPLLLVNYRARFGLDVHPIHTYDSKKSIQLLNSDNEVELPHNQCPTYPQLQACAAHIDTHRTLLRYLDLDAVVGFLKRVKADVPFTAVGEVTPSAVKLLYLKALQAMPEEGWPATFTGEQSCRRKVYPSTIRVSREDAHTVTEGPAIYLAEDVQRVGQFCLETAKIPPSVMGVLLKNMEVNNATRGKMARLQKEIEDANSADAAKEKKMADGRVSPAVKKLQEELARLMLLPVVLPFAYIPNSAEHLARFGVRGGFESNVDADIAVKILETKVDDMWKLLLLMGIGVFMQTDEDYVEIVKELAAKQKLFLIIADSDYIYGTNYQLSHAYIAKDLVLSQQKVVQALGRVGRGKLQQAYTVRVRHPTMLTTLFMPETHKLEASLMNQIFS